MHMLTTQHCNVTGRSDLTEYRPFRRSLPNKSNPHPNLELLQPKRQTGETPTLQTFPTQRHRPKPNRAFRFRSSRTPFRRWTCRLRAPRRSRSRRCRRRSRCTLSRCPTSDRGATPGSSRRRSPHRHRRPARLTGSVSVCCLYLFYLVYNKIHCGVSTTSVFV
jgi:hypothetical protein